MNNEFKSKIENFWYHYKIQTIAGILILFLVLATVIFDYNPNKADAVICYVGTSDITEEYIKNINENFSDVIDDLNGDGKKIISVKQIKLNDEKSLTSVEILTKLDLEAASGESVLFLVDEFAYKPFKERGTFGTINIDNTNYNFIGIDKDPRFNSEAFPFNAKYLVARNKRASDDKDKKTQGYIVNSQLIAKRVLRVK